MLVDRAGGTFIEVFDSALGVDAGRLRVADPPRADWDGFAHLDGQTVKVTADGVIQPDAAVEGGAVRLDRAATTCIAGLGFIHVIEPLPVTLASTGLSAAGSRNRPVAVTLRLLETATLDLDVGRGLADVPLRRFRSPLGERTKLFTGDITVRAYGWRQDASQGLWRIAQNAPLPFTLLSVATDISAS